MVAVTEKLVDTELLGQVEEREREGTFRGGGTWKRNDDTTMSIYKPADVQTMNHENRLYCTIYTLD